MVRRFVIQQHQKGSNLHWDLMLEEDRALATWQIEIEPARWPLAEFPGIKIFDHRLKYLGYEGPVSRGRGRVKIVARGGYETITQRENYWQLRLIGDIIAGVLELTHVQDDSWQIKFNPEEK